MKTIVLTTILTICMVGVAQAGPTTFDFEGLANGTGAAGIETYMEGIYGPDITVLGSPVITDVAPLGSDKWVKADGGGGANDWVSFSFNTTPIISVSFDWATDKNYFYADADNVNFFTYTNPDNQQHNGTMTTYTFGSPVTILKFHDGQSGWVGIDNLVVEKYVASTQPNVIPAPGAILLGSIGVSLVGWLRRRRTL